MFVTYRSFKTVLGQFPLIHVSYRRFGRATFDKTQKFFSLTKPEIYPDLVDAVPIENFRMLIFDDPGTLFSFYF
jgi:hypothetical protein